MRTYDAMILTGGSARRLGGIDKPAVLVGAEPMVVQVARAASAAARLVVVGPAHPLLRPDAVTREEPPGSGPVAAVAAGLHHITAPQVAVLAGDLPFLRQSTIAELQAALGDHDAALVQDEDGRAQWLCALWSTAALRRATAGDPAGRSMRSLYAAADALAVRTTVGSRPPAWFDVDTGADLDRARAWAADSLPESEES